VTDAPVDSHTGLAAVGEAAGIHSQFEAAEAPAGSCCSRYCWSKVRVRRGRGKTRGRRTGSSYG